MHSIYTSFSAKFIKEEQILMEIKLLPIVSLQCIYTLCNIRCFINTQVFTARDSIA